MTIPAPTFVRIEYWSPLAADWWVGHAGLNLMDPEKYVTGVTANQNNDQIARAVVVETGEVINPRGFAVDLL